MTIRAYVLIEAAVGQGNEVLAALREVPETIQADRVTGPYDVICVFELDDLDGLGTLVRERIHLIKGIARTISCVAFSWSEP